MRATPLWRLRCALQRTCGVRNNPNSKQDKQFIVTGFTTFSHSTPFALCNTSLGDFFLLSPPPPPPLIRVCLGLGVGVMGNAGLCSRSVLVHLKGLIKLFSPCGQAQEGRGYVAI